MSERLVVLGAARTPFGRFGGPMRDVPIPALGAVAATAAMSRAGVAPGDVDELVMGVNLPGSDRSIARQTALRAGLPESTTAYTVDRACCSSLTALTLARRAVASGDARIALAGGGENLSRVPYYLEGVRFGGTRLGNIVLDDQLAIACPYTGVPRAVQAADEAAAFGIDRAAQDDWALRSQERAAAAQHAGLFDDEIAPVTVDDAVTIDRDESIRTDTTLAGLAALSPVNGSATVTAGNAPGLSTGASFVVVAGSGRPLGGPPVAEVLSVAQAAGHPAKIGSIPADAAQVALRRAGLTLDDIDLVEINEAFAAVALIATRVLAGGEAAARELRERTNVNGGAIALGHPTGATGLRLLMTAASELRRRGGGRALIAMCGGVGEGEAVVIQVGGTSR